MTTQRKFEYLQQAFNELGLHCSVNPSNEDPDMARFAIQRGEATLAFTAHARPVRNPLSTKETKLFVAAEKQRMCFAYGYKNPDAVKYRFYLTGFKRQEGEDAKSYDDRLEARRIASEIHQKLAV